MTSPSDLYYDPYSSGTVTPRTNITEDVPEVPWRASMPSAGSSVRFSAPVESVLSSMQRGPKGPRILVGIDYGTTFSGLAWLETDGERISVAEDVKVFEAWPEKDAKKVPSKFSYSESEDGQYRQWGWSIDPRSFVLQWTKLLLDTLPLSHGLEKLKDLIQARSIINDYVETPNASSTLESPEYLAKGAEDVVRDYITEMVDEWYDFMKDKFRNTLREVPLDIVITHPAEWSYEACNKTLRAVKDAFPRGKFKKLRDIYITSEPEAAASSVVQDILTRDTTNLIEGECFVVCDAGGGTVDLASYYIESVHPLRVTPVGSIRGRKCGATFIDRAFLEWLQPRISGLDLLPNDYTTGGHHVVLPQARMLLERFERQKQPFDGTGEIISIPVPRGTTFINPAESTGTINLPVEDMRRIFSKSVDGTVDLVAAQVKQLKLTRRAGIPYKVKNIFLSGGFGESPYLLAKVKKWAKSQRIEVSRASEVGESWSGVVRGAVLQGIGMGIQGTTKIRFCERFYGIILSQPYDYRHDSQATERDRYSGQTLALDQAVWAIHKGDHIPPDGPLISENSITFNLSSSDLSALDNLQAKFIATREDDPPRNVGDMDGAKKQVVKLNIPLARLPPGALTREQRENRTRMRRYYRQVKIIIRIEVDKQVKITALWEGTELMVERVEL